ncbi:MAG: hypothetical protein AAGF11_37630 [Myxococcota bacterium]
MDHAPSPLGFSDLTQDEALLVSIFRSWVRQASAQADFEQSARDLLRLDHIYPALDDLFVFFRSFCQRPEVHVNEHEVLSATEEQLLTVLGEQDARCRDTATDGCRATLRELSMKPRPTDEITRSGDDLLHAKLAQSYQTVMSAHRL